MPNTDSVRVIRADGDGDPFTPIKSPDGSVTYDSGDGIIPAAHLTGGSLPQFKVTMGDGLPGLVFFARDALGNEGPSTYVSFYYAGGAYPVNGYIKTAQDTFSTVTAFANTTVEMFLWIPDAFDVAVEKTDVHSFFVQARRDSDPTKLQTESFSLSPSDAYAGDETLENSDFWQSPPEYIMTRATDVYNVSWVQWVPEGQEGSPNWGAWQIKTDGVMFYKKVMFVVESIDANSVAPPGLQTNVSFFTKWSDNGTAGDEDGGVSDYMDLANLGSGDMTYDFLAPGNVEITAPTNADVFADSFLILSGNVD